MIYEKGKISPSYVFSPSNRLLIDKTRSENIQSDQIWLHTGAINVSVKTINQQNEKIWLTIFREDIRKFAWITFW